MLINVRNIRVFLWSLPLLLLLSACSDDRASFQIRDNPNKLTLIRETRFPWEKTAKYFIVPSRMPDCMRKHALPDGPLNVKTEVFSPGNDAWIIRQNRRVFVTETRTCEGFAVLEKDPEDGYGKYMGLFEMKDGKLVFTPAPDTPPAPEK